MPVFNNALAGAAGSGGAAGYKIERSLRFERAHDSYLLRTPSSAGNRKTWTFSCWAKLAEVGTNRELFVGGGSPWLTIQIASNDKFYVSWTAGSSGTPWQSDALFRDTSAWYHFVVAWDTTQSTAANRLKVYANGVQLTGNSSYPSQNTDYQVNSTAQHGVGGWKDELSGYLAEVQFIDGQALAPTDFGEFDADTGVWNPKRFTGNHGTNGFHLDFSDNSSDAALGTDSSGNDNDFTVNNLTANTSGTNYTDISTLAALSGSSLDSSYNDVSKVFDGSGTGVRTVSEESNQGEKLSITFSPAITLDNETVSIDTSGTYQGMFVTVDGSDGSRVSGSDSAVTTLTTGSLSGSLSKITVDNGTDSSGRPASVLRIRIGGTELRDPAAAKDIDSLIDTPTNYEADSGNNGGNYATLNPLQTGSGITLSNGSLDLDGTSSWKSSYSSIFLSSGKWYTEYTIRSITTHSYGIMVGLAGLGTNSIESEIGSSGDSYAIQNGPGDMKVNHNGTSSGQGPQAAYAVGDVLQLAWDADNGKLFFGKNGTWINSGNPVSGANAVRTNLTGTYCFAVSLLTASDKISANFGQRPFAHTPPTGYKSICTQNLDDPLIADGSDYFDVVTATAQAGQSNRQFSLEFSPDFIWAKSRNLNYHHDLFDSVRGRTKRLMSSSADAESTYTTALQSFDTNGFTWGNEIPLTLSGTYGSSVDESGVFWCWDAGSSNTSISVGGLNSSLYNTSSTWRSNWTASGNGFDSYPVSNIFDANLDNYMNNDAGGQYITWNTTSYTLSGELLIDVRSSSGVYDIYVNGSKAADTTGTRQWVNCGTFADINEIQFAGTSYGTSNGLGSAGVVVYGIKVGGKQLIDSNVTLANVPSIASTYRANPTAGFSIVTYTGNGTDDATVGHGLNATPEWIIVKRRDSADDWFVYTLPTANNILKLNATDAASASSHFRTMSSSTFQLSGNADVNANNGTFVAYCFAPVEGYSAFGSYEGTGTSDGAFNYTGMRPAWVMIKRVTNAESWVIYDTSRNTHNGTVSRLFADLTNAEGDNTGHYIDILSNGFKVRSGGGLLGASGDEYVWIAFAENPFKTARAR